MKQKFILLLLMLGLFAAPAVAGMTITWDGTRSAGSGPGGIFNFTSSGDFYGQSIGSFKAYCVETSEYISWNVAYDVINISKYAWKGGTNTSNPGETGIVPGYGPQPVDYIDPVTAYLHEMHISPANNTEADDTQDAMWYTENEMAWSALTPQAQTYYNNAVTAVGTGTTIGANVWVLNITQNGQVKQDQLVSLPDYVAPIPAPGAVVLGGIGVGLVGWLRRRRTL